jgi:hypothetical protein
MLATLGLGAFAVAMVWRGGARRAPGAAQSDRDAPAAAPSAAAMGTVRALAGRHDPGAVSELVAVYGKLAEVPATLEARRLIVKSLLEHPNITVGLQAVLAAVAADTTPKQQDPMWPHLVQGVASLWDAMTVAHGRDLVMLETRPKPRNLLLESLAQVAPQKLSDVQKAALVSDLIDLYPTLTPEEKPAVDRALAALGGPDLVEILAGRGLAEGSPLKAAVEEQQALEATRHALHVSTDGPP